MKVRRLSGRPSSQRSTIRTACSTFALDKVADCGSCGHDRRHGAHHASVPSTFRASVRACRPRPALGREPSDLSGAGRNAADHWAALTDVEPPDAFRRVAAGRVAFRTVDLLTLRGVLRGLANRMDDGDA